MSVWRRHMVDLGLTEISEASRSSPQEKVAENLPYCAQGAEQSRAGRRC